MTVESMGIKESMEQPLIPLIPLIPICVSVEPMELMKRTSISDGKRACGDKNANKVNAKN